MSKTILGLITIIAAQFVPVEELETVIEAIGIIVAWYGRFTAVDSINIFGIKKV